MKASSAGRLGNASFQREDLLLFVELLKMSQSYLMNPEIEEEAWPLTPYPPMDTNK